MDEKIITQLISACELAANAIFNNESTDKAMHECFDAVDAARSADGQQDDYVELAKNHMEKDRPTKAFFLLALEAVTQLKRMADAQAKLAESVYSTNGYGYINVRPDN